MILAIANSSVYFTQVFVIIVPVVIQNAVFSRLFAYNHAIGLEWIHYLHLVFFHGQSKHLLISIMVLREEGDVAML